MEPIETPRLILRDFAMDDWKPVQEYASDPQVVKLLAWGPNSAEQTIDFVRRTIEEARQAKRRKFGLAVTLKEEDGRVIGGARLDLTARYREADLGYVIHRKFWGKGYATEAARGLLELGFGRLGLHRVVASCSPENPASRRVLEKAGMRHEGHLRESNWIKNDWQDELIFSMLHRDWRGLKEAGI